jgi:hypothetical protein
MFNISFKLKLYGDNITNDDILQKKNIIYFSWLKYAPGVTI